MSPNTVISLDTENNDKSPDPFIKRRKKKKNSTLKVQWNFNFIKERKKKSSTDILNAKRLNIFLIGSGNKAKIATVNRSIKHCTGGSSHAS